MATTVHVKNIAADTTEAQVRDFFSFCGKISSLSLSKDGTTQTASVTFEKPTAGKTALLLDNTQLGSNTVSVTSNATLEELAEKSGSGGGAAGTGEDDRDVDQEDKPRSRIVAEYLAHGYSISDKAIEQALALDKQHGVSSRFTSALQQFDQRYRASERAAQVDQRYSLTERANAGWRTMNSYFEKAIDTPTGRRLHQFYQVGEKQVLDVHNEARRLADMRAGKAQPASGSAAQGGAAAAAPQPSGAGAPTAVPPASEKTGIPPPQ